MSNQMATVFNRVLLGITQRYRSLSRSAVLRSNISSTTNENKTPNTENGDNKVVVSASCLQRLREICKNDNFLRVTVEGGGCSGFQYKFDLDDKLNDCDLIFGDDHAKVVIDKVSLEYCAGSTVEYHSELIRSGFRIVANPKAEAGCSCGASFAIKMD